MEGNIQREEGKEEDGKQKIIIQRIRVKKGSKRRKG